MDNKTVNNVIYEPPSLEIFSIEEIYENLGPVVSCSGYGGATSGCN